MRSVQASITTGKAARAIEAFTSVEAMRGWWQAEKGLVDARAGGVWALSWQSNRYASTGRIATLEPTRLVIADYLYLSPERAILGPMTLTVSVDGEQVTVTQDGYREGPDWDWYYEAVVAAWPRVLPSVKAWLER